MAGRGSGRSAADRAATWLESRGHAVERAETGPRLPAAEAAARAAADGTDRVLAIGGDGTVALVAEGLLAAGTGTPLGIVPRGTANILAMNLGLPSRLLAAVAVAVDGVVAPIDVGRLEGEAFLLTVSAGLHAEMVARATRGLKRRLGVAAYGVAGLRASQSARPSRYRIECDGRVLEEEASMVQVMNCGAVFLRAWEFAPGISPVDGLFDVLVYRARTIPEYLATAAHVLKGTPTANDLVVHERAARVTVEADPPVRLQRDGEMAGGTPAAIEVLPRALPVAMPADGPWAP